MIKIKQIGTISGSNIPIKRCKSGCLESGSGIQSIRPGTNINIDISDPFNPIINSTINNGEDGYTPIKGIDYFDGINGYTPQKNIDYFDGEDGKDFKFEDFTEEQIDLITGSQGLQGIKGDTGEQGPQGIQGIPGIDGSIQTITMDVNDDMHLILQISSNPTIEMIIDTDGHLKLI